MKTKSPYQMAAGLRADFNLSPEGCAEFLRALLKRPPTSLEMWEVECIVQDLTASKKGRKP